MTWRVPRSVWWTAGVGAAIAVCVLFFRFPWRHMATIIAEGNVGLLPPALLINLASPFAKGWAWHLLLKPVAPNRWRTAQEANLVGAAVNNVSIAVGGEAARIHYIAQRDNVPVGAAISSVVWTRVTETIALAIFLVMA